MTLHKSLTYNRVLRAAKQQMFGTESPGYCIACGTRHDNCEPDMRKGTCEKCNTPTVYGAEELLFYVNP